MQQKRPKTAQPRRDHSSARPAVLVASGIMLSRVAGLIREYLFHGTYAKAGITVAGNHGELSDPTGVAVDRSGHLFVFDAGNNHSNAGHADNDPTLRHCSPLHR